MSDSVLTRELVLDLLANAEKKRDERVAAGDSAMYYEGKADAYNTVLALMGTE